MLKVLMVFCALLCSYEGVMPLHVSENVVFTKVNQISTSRSKWLISMIIDLEPFERFVTQMTLDITDCEILVRRISSKYASDLRFRSFMNSFVGLRKELQHLSEVRETLVKAFADYQSLHPRHKRSLIPILGKFLHVVTGVLTKADLRSIKTNLHNLASNQDKLSHVLESSLTIVNISQVHISENRHQLNVLGKVLSAVKSNITEVTAKINHKLQGLEYFIQLYLQLDLMAGEMKDTIQVATFYLNTLRLQLSNLALGHLSVDIAPPNMLRNILHEIEANLPSNLQLPADPLKDIWSYYQLLTCTTLMENNKIIVVVSLPLTDVNSQFDIYSIKSLPYIPDPSLVTLSTDMTAEYQLEADAIALNPERSKFILLTSQELQRCSIPSVEFCTIQSPVFPVNLSKMCITSLFLQEKNEISKNCQAKVDLTSKLPQAKYLQTGLWAITSKVSQTFTIICATGERTSKTTTPPISIIELDQTCTATSNYLTLLPYFFRESKYYIRDPLDKLIHLSNVSKIQLWNPVYDAISFLNQSDIQVPSELKEIGYIPMGHLVNELKSLKPLTEEKSKSFLWYLKTIGVAILIIIVVLGILYYKYRAKLAKMFISIFGSNDTGTNTPEATPMMVSNKVEGEVANTAAESIAAPSLKSTLTQEVAGRKVFPMLTLASAPEMAAV